MAWTIRVSKDALKQLRKIDRADSKRILNYMEQISRLGNPHARGKALTGNFGGLWRYRVGDYRVICDVQSDVLTILVLRVGHRREVYK
nr:type II toxin-antitoxin system RelE/ParE family toxin [Gleimia europaea]